MKNRKRDRRALTEKMNRPPKVDADPMFCPECKSWARHKEWCHKSDVELVPKCQSCGGVKYHNMGCPKVLNLSNHRIR